MQAHRNKSDTAAAVAGALVVLVTAFIGAFSAVLSS
jgi:hypothetical protein